VKVKVDKTVLASVALHVFVLGWVMVSFSTKALEMPPEDSVSVDVISPDQLAKVMAGMKTGKKENPKPLVDKIAEAKPVDEAVGKITEKAPVVTETAPAPQPKVEEKPVEKKPDPPKVVEKPREEPKQESVEKKPDPVKPDPIAEAIKKEEKKPPPKPVQAAKPPEPPKPKVERTFDQSKIAALLDKRDPSRQAAAGETLNSNAALGLAKGAAANNSATWGSIGRSRHRAESTTKAQPESPWVSAWQMTIVIDRMCPARRRSIARGCTAPWRTSARRSSHATRRSSTCACFARNPPI